jgi:hypothetical protein
VRNFALGLAAFALLVSAPVAKGQNTDELKKILERLDKLERENQALRSEVKELRVKLEGPTAPPPEAALPSVEERLEVAEKRIDEQAQTKVEMTQRFPLKLTGMVLFNTYANMRHNGGTDISTSASLAATRMNAGISVKQSIIGLKFDGPKSIWGAKVNADLFMDFYDGNIEGNTLAPRIRTGGVSLDWASQSIRFAYDKPIFSPRDPTSLATVGIAPLTSAGNLWRWQPQVRFEQRFQWKTGTSWRNANIR